MLQVSLPEGKKKHVWQGLSAELLIQCFGVGLIFCISNKLPRDLSVTILGTNFKNHRSSPNFPFRPRKGDFAKVPWRVRDELD